MKHLYRTLPIKIICFILCIIMLALTIASAFGIFGLFALEVYTKSEEDVFESLSYSMLRGDAYNIVFYNLVPEAYSLNYRFPFENDSSNVRFRLVSPSDEVIATNIGSVESEHSSRQYKFPFEVVYSYDESSQTNVISAINAIDRITNQENIYTLELYLEENLPVNDRYTLVNTAIHAAYSLRYWIYVIGVFALALLTICFITLMCGSARRPGSDRLHPGPLNKIPFDLLLAIVSTLFIASIYLIDLFYTGEALMMTAVIILCVLAVIVGLGLCMSVAARIKQHSLLKNTACYMLIKFLWKAIVWTAKMIKRGALSLFELVMSIPLIWRTLFVVAFSVALDFLIIILAFSGKDITVFIWAVKNIIFALTVLYGAMFMRKLQKGGNALATGDLSYKTDTSNMFWDFKKHGENLNSIATGMSKAIEERLSSERMKAELITNVSHDIKTPLTSIINYANLISEEKCGCEKHKEYAEVLTRKSEHLKRLLDDLVEISKATTGNLEVSLSPCDAGVLLTQASGEFEQKCESAGLELITIQSENKIMIMADSRRIWRVFENLMNNACKYSLPGSRVYLTLAEEKGEALFIFRNTSRNILNISPSELTERFVRGDSSRTTEGNGLGLSIAQSLTELQNGKMDITIDGDLFKVTLRFPII